MSAIQPRVVVQGVGKCYVKYDDTPLLATSALRWRTKSARSLLWALRDIDLAIAPGECVGVIGHNGSGKSTLMRLLAGVTGPTVGRVAVRGRIAPLISVGVGFHPELTGRENVFLNGIILGLSRQQLDRKFDDIVDFAEIGPFIDTPVKFYSTGMFMRLGFAVSVLADPQVLLVDEVLAVGDLAFQIKCFDRMQEIRAAGTTVVLVSHNLAAVRRMCDRTVVLNHGRMHHDGDTGEAIAVLHSLLQDQEDSERSTMGLDTKSAPTARSRLADIDQVALHVGDENHARRVRSDDTVKMVAELRFSKDVDAVLVGVNIRDERGGVVYAERVTFRCPTLHAGVLTCIDVSLMPTLGSGSYALQVGIAELDGSDLVASPPIDFFVDGRECVEGSVDLRARISMRSGGTTAIRIDER